MSSSARALSHSPAGQAPHFFWTVENCEKTLENAQAEDPEALLNPVLVRNREDERDLLEGAAEPVLD